MRFVQTRKRSAATSEIVLSAKLRISVKRRRRIAYSRCSIIATMAAGAGVLFLAVVFNLHHIIQGKDRTALRLEAQSKQLDDKLLRKALFSNYSTHVHSFFKPPPSLDLNSLTSPVSPLYLIYHLVKILNMDEKQEELSVSVYLQITWTDMRLQWNEFEYNVSEIELELKDIWHPDLIFSNGIGDLAPLKGIMLALVRSDGLITWSGMWQMRAPCEMDITYFPLDSQVCKQQFRLDPAAVFPAVIGIWATPDQSRLQNVVLYDDSAWFIDRRTDIRITNRQNLQDMVMTIELTLSRRYEYYKNRILAPITILGVLVMVGFFIPPDAGEKLGFGITLLLTFSVFQTMIDADLPASSVSTPLLTAAMIRLQVLSSMSIIASVIVLNVHHLGPEYWGDMPQWLNFLFFTILAKMTLHKSTGRKLRMKRKKRKQPVGDRSKGNMEYNVDDTVAEDLANDTEEPNEWKVAAMILDRLLMYVCFLVLIVFYASLMTHYQAMIAGRPSYYNESSPPPDNNNTRSNQWYRDQYAQMLEQL